MIIDKVYGLDEVYGRVIGDEKELLILLSADNSPREDTHTLIHELLHILIWNLHMPKVFHIALDGLDKLIGRRVII